MVCTRIVLVAAVLMIGLSGGAFAQPVLFDISTSTGNDTMFVGIPGSIDFTADANGNTVAVITWATEYIFSGSNVIGPITENGSPPGAAFSFDQLTTVDFEQKSFNQTLGDDFVDTPRDTLLWGLFDLGSSSFTGSGVMCRLVFTPTDVGTITIDSTSLAGSQMEVFDPIGTLLPFAWNGPYTITVIQRCNCPPFFVDCDSDVSPALFGSMVTATVGADEGPVPLGPLQYFVADATNSSGTGPNNAPQIVGGGTTASFRWQTSDANFDDVGTWTFEIGATNGFDTIYCSFQTEVYGQTPFELSIDNVDALMDYQIDVCINLQKGTGPRIAGGFDLTVCFDPWVLTFMEAAPGAAVIDHGWEYWSYRLEDLAPGRVRIMAIADMDGGGPGPDSLHPIGALACLHFMTTSHPDYACQRWPIRFCWEDCGDNVILSQDGATEYVASVADGGIVDANGAQIMCAEPDPWGYNASVVCAGCPADSNAVVPAVRFTNGSVRIVCPGDMDYRGDINLNGIYFEPGDAVLFTNYLIWGDSVLDPTWYEAQIAASDVNNDGQVLTPADLAFLIKIIRDGIPFWLYKLDQDAGSGGGFEVGAAREGNLISVEASHEADVSVLLLVFAYEGTGIRDVRAGLRAAEMDIKYGARDGELRVLIYQIGPGRIAAGSGSILEVVTAGACDVRLMSAEAAAYDGSALTTRMTGAVTPERMVLYPNYPNPFNPSTTLAAEFPAPSDYTLTIFNVAGQVVRQFAGSAPAGRLEVVWDGRDDRGMGVGSGVYFYRIEAGGYEAVRKMVLMK